MVLTGGAAQGQSRGVRRTTGGAMAVVSREKLQDGAEYGVLDCLGGRDAGPGTWAGERRGWLGRVGGRIG